MKIKIITIYFLLGFSLSSLFIDQHFMNDFGPILTNPLHENFYKFKEIQNRKALEVSDNFFQLIEKPDDW